MYHLRLVLIFLTAGVLCLQSACKGPTGSMHWISGAYCSNSNNPDEAELQPRGKMAYEKEGKIFATPTTLSKLDFSKGLAAISVSEKGWLFVKPDGSTIPTLTIDNGPDYFCEGLARYVDGGKTGFIDPSGNIVINAQFGFACPFKSGYSKVCDDFSLERLDEHQLVKSDHWGCIDKTGHLILPMEYSLQEIETRLSELKQTQSHKPATSR